LSGENKPKNGATYTVEQILMHTDAVVDIRNVGVGCGLEVIFDSLKLTKYHTVN